jgi:hypothetical protein
LELHFGKPALLLMAVALQPAELAGKVEEAWARRPCCRDNKSREEGAAAKVLILRDLSQ